jgi:prolipoprotein diacylglyceryltransferase
LAAEYAGYEYFHTTFFYESALDFIGFVVLRYLARKWRRNRLYGDIFFLYTLIYAVIRFFIEFLRPDAWEIAGVPTAQWVSIAMFVVSGSLMLARHRLRRPSMIYTPGHPWEPPSEGASAPQAAADRSETDSEEEDPSRGV